MRPLGILLIVVGVVALVVGSTGYRRTREVGQVGSITLSYSKRERLPAARIGGAIALIAGVGLVVAGQRRRDRVT